ncbi:hypothetical protein [Goodfellowiella coeruleoviolacea]|nr:hypothetical protein [Goodfellowiella coeruleoviolacea]
MRRTSALTRTGVGRSHPPHTAHPAVHIGRKLALSAAGGARRAEVAR